MDNNDDKQSSTNDVDKADINKKLLEIRDSIDAIDDQVLELISKRAECAEKVAEIKRQAGEVNLWFYRPEREAQVLNRMSESNRGPLENERITAIYTNIDNLFQIIR